MVLAPASEPVSVAANRRPKMAEWWAGFLAQSGSPVNLAVFRIVVFAVLLLCPDFWQSVDYSAVPKELMFPPACLGGWLQSMPINPQVDSWACLFFALFCISAMIGFHARKSSFAAALLGLYVLGIPQMFGKVKHETPELIWFAFILAACDCAAVLSVDAAIKGWRLARPHVGRDLGPDVRYGLPLKIVWLLLGIIYFFPGYWKLHNCGLAWALGDNLRWHILGLATESGHLPLLHIYDIPWLYKAAGLGTLAFETSFVFLVFNPIGRIFVTIAGLLFHTGIWLAIGIRFFELQACYVVLIDWQRFCHWMGRRLFPEMMTLTYDENDLPACRFLSMLRSFDLLGRIDWRRSANAGLSPLSSEIGSNRAEGMAAYLAVMRRIPASWILFPAWPLLVPALSKQRTNAENGSAQQQSAAISPDALSIAAPRSPLGLLPVIAVASLIVAGDLWYGWQKTTDSWPVACYPTFANISKPLVGKLVVVPLDENGRRIDLGSSMSVFNRGRREALWRHILKQPPQEAGSDLAVLWRYMQGRDGALRGAATVNFYLEAMACDPDLWSKNPIEKHLLMSLKRGH